MTATTSTAPPGVPQAEWYYDILWLRCATEIFTFLESSTLLAFAFTILFLLLLLPALPTSASRLLELQSHANYIHTLPCCCNIKSDPAKVRREVGRPDHARVCEWGCRCVDVLVCVCLCFCICLVRYTRTSSINAHGRGQRCSWLLISQRSLVTCGTLIDRLIYIHTCRSCRSMITGVLHYWQTAVLRPCMAVLVCFVPIIGVVVLLLAFGYIRTQSFVHLIPFPMHSNILAATMMISWKLTHQEGNIFRSGPLDTLSSYCLAENPVLLSRQSFCPHIRHCSYVFSKSVGSCFPALHGCLAFIVQ